MRLSSCLMWWYTRLVHVQVVDRRLGQREEQTLLTPRSSYWIAHLFGFWHWLKDMSRHPPGSRANHRAVLHWKVVAAPAGDGPPA